MLESEKEAELIEGYQCDGCSKKVAVKRAYSIWRLPQTLCLVLKRFKSNGQKIHTRVAALAADGIDFAPFFSFESPEKAGVTRYRLRSIVDHHGSSRGGHYTAQAKHHSAEKWYFYDDEGVSDMKGSGPLFGESTYMLFLERGGA
jgi:ubiquitin C-terminal hydrolase